MRKFLITATAILVLATGAQAGAAVPTTEQAPAAIGYNEGIALFDDATGRWTMADGATFYYGAPGDQPLMCDWDGDGSKTVGLYRPSNGYLFLKNYNAQGPSDREIYYGIPGDRPVCGDWDGDGVESIGIFRSRDNRFYLRNANTQGFADNTFEFGFSAASPFAGDWDGDRVDTVGVRDAANGYVALAATNGPGGMAFDGFFGDAGDRFVVGDWNGNGVDSFGVYRPAARKFMLANSLGLVADSVVDAGYAPEVAPTPRPAPAPAAPAPAPPAAAAPAPVSGPLTALNIPAGAVSIPAGANIQGYVDGYPDGTAFVLEAGTFVGQTVRPRSGQSFFGRRGPNGERLAVLDGRGAADGFVANGAGNVTVAGLAITGYSGGAINNAAINCRFPGGGGSWTIQDNEISYSTNGIHVGGSARVLGNNVHHNAIYGMTGSGDGILIEGNEIAYNRTNTSYDPGNSSATKFVLTKNLVVRNNWVHHNQGHGIWPDINNLNALIEGNRVEDNWWIGIFYEISYSAVIRNNYLARNGFNAYDTAYGNAAINITNSPDCQVYGNTLEGNAQNIVSRQWAHPGDSGTLANHEWMYGERVLKNLQVFDNVIL